MQVSLWIRVATSLIACFIVASAALEAKGKGLAIEQVGASTSNLALPHDIVLSPDGQRLYVADNGNDRIVVLAAASLRELGTFGEGEVSEPHDVDFDPQGRLLVADTGNHRIAIYSLDDPPARLVGVLKGQIRRPEGVAAHPDGRVLATGSSSNNLVVFSGATVLKETGGFSSPHDVAIDAAGRFWVADANNNRLVQLDEDLTTARIIAGPPYNFNGPRYLDFDALGRLFIADKYNHQIKILAPEGELLLVVGTPSAGTGRFDRPEGVAIRGEYAWFSDTYNNRIVRYRIYER